MKIELNIGLHSKKLGNQNPIEMINALTGRGFEIVAYRVAQAICDDGQEPCLAVRGYAPDDWQAQVYSLAEKYGQDCIAVSLFVGPSTYSSFDASRWITPDLDQAISKAERITRDIIATMPEIYQDALYRASSKQYHERNTQSAIPSIH